jgi:general stress protein 26
MTDQKDIVARFWKSLRHERTLMLSLIGSEEDAKPMTAIVDGDDDRGPLWIFTAKDTELVQELSDGAPAAAQFVAKGHDLFAAVRGRLTPDNDRAVIERLWSPFIAAWYEGGKDDPKLQLLRFDLDHAQIWLDENSLFAGVKLLLGSDPKKDYADKVAETPLQ